MFHSRRGLNQGDSLSPSLFVVVVKILARLLDRVAGCRELKMYKVDNTEVESNLSYADDFILFCKATMKPMDCIRGIIDKFSEFSGLALNVQKSGIIFSKGVLNKQELAGLIGFPTQELPFNYVGVLITGRSIIDYGTF